jgi:hypothetical protein
LCEFFRGFRVDQVCDTVSVQRFHERS